jgi:hypothetical protein
MITEKKNDSRRVLFSWDPVLVKTGEDLKTYSIDWISPNIELLKKQEK